MINRRIFVALAAGALLVAACGDDGDSGAGVKVANAWARQSPMATTMGAVYLDLTSTKADTLVSVSVPATVAAKAELHETVEVTTPETTMPGTTMAGSATTMAGAPEMTMRPVAKIDLPAKTTVSLKPGGYHIMLIDLVKPLEVGQSIDVTLTFGSGAQVATSVEVRADAP